MLTGGVQNVLMHAGLCVIFEGMEVEMVFVSYKLLQMTKSPD